MSARALALAALLALAPAQAGCAWVRWMSGISPIRYDVIIAAHPTHEECKDAVVQAVKGHLKNRNVTRISGSLLTRCSSIPSKRGSFLAPLRAAD